MCNPLRKIDLELDGGGHNLVEIQEYDKVRQEYIEAFGIKIIRFSNSDVFNNVERVIEDIRFSLKHKPLPWWEVVHGSKT